MTNQPVKDSNVKRKIFSEEQYEENIEKTITAINRWFRNQDDDVAVYGVYCQQGITGFFACSVFSIAVIHTET